MKQYTPRAFDTPEIRETDHGAIYSVQRPSLLRRTPIERIVASRTHMKLHSAALPSGPLLVAKDLQMVFGKERIRAWDYVWRVLESNDLVDAVVEPFTEGVLPVQIFWIHIVYVGEPREAGQFSKKEDGDFALRTKSGEKAERFARGKLAELGHDFGTLPLESPGHFEIRYAGKTRRELDGVCTRCGLKLEVKKRNKDRHVRISHSVNRPFDRDNDPDGWHVFVTPNREAHFLSNRDILDAIEAGAYTHGQSTHDTWLQLHASLEEIGRSPPPCVPRDDR